LLLCIEIKPKLVKNHATTEVKGWIYVDLIQFISHFYTARSAGQKGCVNIPLLRKGDA
jgi:hypothetical protein